MRKHELTRKIRTKGSMKDPDFFKWNRELQHVVARLTRLDSEAPPSSYSQDFDDIVADLML